MGTLGCWGWGHQGFEDEAWDGDTIVPGMGTGTLGYWGQQWEHQGTEDRDVGVSRMGTRGTQT